MDLSPETMSNYAAKDINQKSQKDSADFVLNVEEISLDMLAHSSRDKLNLSRKHLRFMIRTAEASLHSGQQIKRVSIFAVGRRALSAPLVPPAEEIIPTKLVFSQELNQLPVDFMPMTNNVLRTSVTMLMLTLKESESAVGHKYLLSEYLFALAVTA